MSRPGSSSSTNHGSQRRRDELSIAQKMFNQRLLAEHCWTEAQAQQIYTDEILSSTNATGDSGPRDISLIDTIKLCNSHLSDFGLEIVSITVPDYTNHVSNDDEDDDEEEEVVVERPQRRPISSSTIKYFTMVNKFPDTITKEVYQNYLFQPPTLQSYVKQVLLHLAQQYPTPSSRATLLNLKNNTNETLSSTTSTNDGNGIASQAVAQPKVSLSNAEDMLERLLDEQWVMEVVTNRNNKSQRRNSTTNAKIAIGPRALGELSYLISSPATGIQDVEEDDNDDDDKQPSSTSSNHHLKVLLPQPIYIRF